MHFPVHTAGLLSLHTRHTAPRQHISLSHETTHIALWQHLIWRLQHLLCVNMILQVSMMETSKEMMLWRERKSRNSRMKEPRNYYYYFFCQKVPGRQPELNDSAPGQLRALHQKHVTGYLIMRWNEQSFVFLLTKLRGRATHPSGNTMLPPKEDAGWVWWKCPEPSHRLKCHCPLVFLNLLWFYILPFVNTFSIAFHVYLFLTCF